MLLKIWNRKRLDMGLLLLYLSLLRNFPLEMHLFYVGAMIALDEIIETAKRNSGMKRGKSKKRSIPYASPPSAL